MHDGALWRPGEPATRWFRVAEATLEVVTDHPPLVEDLDAIYGDFRIAEPPPGGCDVRCTAARVASRPLLAVEFSAPSLPDLVAAAASPYRFRRRPDYVEIPGPYPGWRGLVEAAGGDRLYLTAQGPRALVNLDEAPNESVADWIVSVAQSVQTGILFMHAGTVGVAGVGALIIAPTSGGKSTTSLAVAQRGHAFLGDDVAAVRLATREALPFPRAAGIREGPLARSLAPRIEACPHQRAVNRFGIERILVRVSDLFPWAVSGPLPLRFAFVLDAVDERPSIAEFRPGLDQRARLQCVVTDTSGAWALSPGRDLMLFLSVVSLLAGLRCHLLRRGSPEDTAALIETVMMEGTCP